MDKCIETSIQNKSLYLDKFLKKAHLIKGEKGGEEENKITAVEKENWWAVLKVVFIKNSPLHQYTVN